MTKAYRAPGVVERFEDMGPALFRDGERAFEVVHATPIADVGNESGTVLVDAPARRHVEDVASKEPGDHEQTEDDIADHAASKILEALGKRKEEVDNVHENQEEMADAGLVVGITAGDKADGDEVVGQHLPMVLAAVLNVDDKHLLDPE